MGGPEHRPKYGDFWRSLEVFLGTNDCEAAPLESDEK